MAKKFKLVKDSPVTICFALALLFLFALDTFALGGKLLAGVLTCPGGKESVPSFNFSALQDYVKLLLHSLGCLSWNAVFFNGTLLLILSPELEERYGSAMLLLMIAISSLVSGVLNACFSSSPVTGQTCIIFMMIFLAGMTELAKKNVRLSRIFVLIFYLIFELYSVYKGSRPGAGGQTNAILNFFKANSITFVSLAGGFFGSFIGFLASPKKRNAPRKSFDDTEVKENSFYDQEPKRKGGLFAKKHSLLQKAEQKRERNADETVVGSIEL